jgi:hypothetical protein
MISSFIMASQENDKEKKKKREKDSPHGGEKMNWSKVFFVSCLAGTAGLVVKIHWDQEDQKRERRESVMKYLEEQKQNKSSGGSSSSDSSSH